MRPQRPAEPRNRAGIWYLIRRVPKAYAHLDPRIHAMVSTEIRVVDDPRGVRARTVVRQLDLELHAYWRGLKDGQAVEAKRRYEAAQRLARALKIDYQTAGELADGPIEEILRRVQMIVDRKSIDDEEEVAAVLGGEARPALRLSGLYEEFERIRQPFLA